MPTYEYLCADCGRITEIVQSINDEPAKLCAVCFRPSLKRIISAGISFSLQGGGWYADGYASKKK